MDSVFNEQILADKLSKINKTQQCIEKLSHWCIFHQSKAEHVVATWDKQFHIAEMVQKVSLLYLANDILQNSKRKGNEFVNEFWKVLPAALKDVMEKGDDRGKNMVPRLVGIWVERRIFGARVRILEEMFLGEELLPPLEMSKKRSRSARIVKRDSRSIKTKLTVGGGTSEKLVSGYHLVLSEHSSENLETSKCKSVIQNVTKMEEDVDLACRKAKRKTLSKYLEEEENALKQCIDKLKVVEANRITLVSQLREALREEESELESVRIQMQVALAQAEKTSNMRKRLDDGNYVESLKQSPVAASPPPLLTDATLKKGLQVPKKSVSAIAAEVAYKRTASTSSQSITTPLLSAFAAEEETKNTDLLAKPTSLPSIPVNSAQLPTNTCHSQ